MTETTTTNVTEWAVQCHTRDGKLYTGWAFTNRDDAVKSGERLGNINGASWWLVVRHRVVTMETSPWTRVTRPRSDQS